MKKFGLIVLLSICANWAAAQTEKGEILVGMGTSLGIGQNDGLLGLAFNSSEIELADGTAVKDTQNSFFISSKAGYFLLDGLALGLDLAVSTSSGTTESPGVDIDSKSSFFGVGPFVRYYIPSGKFLPFAEVNSLFGSRNQNSSTMDFDLDNRYSVQNFGGGIGLAFLLGERSTLDLSANYNSTSLKENDSDLSTKQNSFGLRLGFSMFF